MSNSDLAIVFKNKYLTDLFKYMYNIEEARIVIFRYCQYLSIQKMIHLLNGIMSKILYPELELISLI